MDAVLLISLCLEVFKYIMSRVEMELGTQFQTTASSQATFSGVLTPLRKTRGSQKLC